MRSIHYNRIHPAYWRDRLLRVKSMGLNAIQASAVICKYRVLRHLVGYKVLTPPARLTVCNNGQDPGCLLLMHNQTCSHRHNHTEVPEHHTCQADGFCKQCVSCAHLSSGDCAGVRAVEPARAQAWKLQLGWLR